MTLAFQFALVTLFLFVARYLDNENRRLNAENTRLRQALAESEERERDANEAAMGLTDELDEYRKEEAKRERRREGMALN